MKKNTKIFLLAFSLLFISLPLLAPEAQAQTGLTYQLLEKIPGTSNLGSDLPGYVSALYKVALIVVTLSAVFMLSVGGFMYLTSAGNTAAMGTAKGIIFDSIIGLVIALSAWLILYIINPDLVKLSLTALPPVAVTQGPAPTPAGIGTLPPQSSVELARQILANGNITLATSGDCRSVSGPVTPRGNIQSVADGRRMAYCGPGANLCRTLPGDVCVDDYLRPSETMLRAIWTVGQSMSFTINSIAGGPHTPGSAHYAGRAIDISSPISQALLDAFVAAGAVAPRGNAASMCERNGVNVGCAAGSGANHLHLVFPG